MLHGDLYARHLVLDDMKKRTSNVVNPYGMSPSRPLVSTIPEIKLFYINPSECGLNDNLKSGYANNISLVLFAQLENKTLLIPGDMLKEGMKCLIESDMEFKKLISTVGIDYLVAPHHGLQTSFSEDLFSNTLGNKTRLNIISEKVRLIDSIENRSDVDQRYYRSEYSTGENREVENFSFSCHFEREM